MTKLFGTNISASIKPFDSEDIYATHESKYGKGGWREVDTYADLDLIPEARKTIGMAVYVVDEGNVYILKADGWQKFTAGSGITVTREFKNFEEYEYEDEHGEIKIGYKLELNHGMNKYPSVSVYNTAGTEYMVDVVYKDFDNVILKVKDTTHLESGVVYFN